MSESGYTWAEPVYERKAILEVFEACVNAAGGERDVALLRVLEAVVVAGARARGFDVEPEEGVPELAVPSTPDAIEAEQIGTIYGWLMNAQIRAKGNRFKVVFRKRKRDPRHYTPRSLARDMVRRTLEPLLAAIDTYACPEYPKSQRILNLRLCDPSVGAAVYPCEILSQLAPVLVDAWQSEGILGADLQGADAAVLARSLIGQRCLCSVDLDPVAVQLCRWSIWLEIGSAALPPTCVDHLAKHGDALLGLNEAQIVSFHWLAGEPAQLSLFVLRELLAQAASCRARALALGPSSEAGRELLAQAAVAQAPVRLVADLCLGAFFSASGRRARETERIQRLNEVERWVASSDLATPPDELLQLRAQLVHHPFHWPVEFPEIFLSERPGPLEPWPGHENQGACAA